MIRRFETTTSLVHYSQVDLPNEGKVVCRDKGYLGAIAKGYAATMQRAVRNHPLGIIYILINE